MIFGLAFEIFINFLQVLSFIGFLYLFFDKTESKPLNLVGFSVTVLFLFTVNNYFTFNEMTMNHFDSVIFVSVMIIYSLLLLRGPVYLRIIIPIFVYLLNMILGYVTVYLMPILTGKTFVEVVTLSTTFRCIYLLSVNITYIVLLWIALKLFKKDLVLKGAYDIITYIVLPMLSITVLYISEFIYQRSGYSSSVLPLVVANMIVVSVISVIVWRLLVKTGKNNKIITQLLLTEQKELLYRESVICVNDQIEKITSVKHDMNNNIMTISELLSKGEYEKAKLLCDELGADLRSSNTPVNSSNPTLNAILNVKIKQAEKYKIALTYEIIDNLSFMDDADIISAVGNLCDNAIDYLKALPEENRKIELRVRDVKNYCILTCENIITDSVLDTNPELKTTKDNTVLHGRGIPTLKKIAEKYNGDVIIKERFSRFEASVLLEKPNNPKTT